MMDDDWDGKAVLALPGRPNPGIRRKYQDVPSESPGCYSPTATRISVSSLIADRAEAWWVGGGL